MKKRIGSVLLALALCLSLLPATALAADAGKVSKLNFAFSQPSTETVYMITGGGTAKWIPGADGAQNTLTLNNVVMRDDYNIVRVPANTEIVLIGTNKITATNGKAIWAMNAPLKISGEGSLEVTAPSTADNYALYSSTTGSIDVNIGGALTVNGNIRADSGKLSLQSKDAISVTGSMYGKGSITATAGKSLSIINTSNTAVFASSCTEVSLAAQDGDLTVSGTGSSDYVIYGNWQSTALKLHASGNVSVTGTEYSMQGKTLELSGTIPEGSTLTAYYVDSMTVPAGKTLTNNGTIKLVKYPASVTVFGTLTNNGSIVDDKGAPIQPTVNDGGVITGQVAMDFTGTNTDATGEGYSWDSASKTLTLTNYKMTEPCNDTAIILPDDAKLVLSGENTLNSRNGALIDAKGTLEISGTGSLTGSAGGEAALNAQGNVTITDCTLNLTNPSSSKSVINTNENALTITGSADVSLHTASDSGWGIKTGDGGNLTLGSDAKLTVSGGTGILVGASVPQKVANVRIAGTLDVSGCANLGANLLRVALNMEGSSITAAAEDDQGIYLNGTLTGQTNIKSFTGGFQLTSSSSPIVNCYTVKKDDTLGLYAEGSTVSFTAEQQTGKKFSGWTATGVTLDNATNAEISFTMPGNDVTLTTNYRTSSSGSSSRPSYPITTPDKTENGSVTVTPKSAKRGSVVTITVTPDAGYVLDKLTVTDKDGKDVALTKKSDTEYTFVMPAGKVEITPSFVKQAEEPSRVFVDVKTGDYFYDAVLWAVEKGITNGTSAETFSPEDPCTRAQIVTFLWRAAGSPVVNYAMDLSDVAGDAYYAEAVRWALSEGITTGTSDQTFSPDATCTREQAVTFLYRAVGSPAVSGESAFEDVGADAYYARAVAWAAQNGVTNGISQALFGTGSDCTRAQIVTFLYRAQQGK
mgnify:CR=1 FL=1